jgi:Ferric reductase like transmembrane component
VSALVATASPSALWYLTRGSGVVALVLLTASICLGIATTLRWRTRGMPRFAVAGLHRSLTLMAVVFVALHVATTVLDGFAPIRWKDAVVPFVSPYRPVWLGLGAVAFDLLLALVITSLLRARLGYRLWRTTHWFAYASWPVALVHSLGTGSDARAGWLELLAVACTLTVALVLAARFALGPGSADRRLAAAAASIAVLLGIGVWYRSGPAAHGWASRAGTPASLLARSSSTSAAPPTRTLAGVPQTFRSQFAGTLTASQSGDETVDIRIDGTLRNGLNGTLRLVLQGFPLEDGGVSMTASGVAFATVGTPVYEGHIVGLDGTRISARVAAGSKTIDLQIALRLLQGQSRVTGVVTGAQV